MGPSIVIQENIVVSRGDLLSIISIYTK